MQRLVAVLAAVLLMGTAAVVSRTAPSAPSDPQSAVVQAELHVFGGIHPRISADGTKIVVSRQGAIWTMPRTGGTLTRLTSGEGFDIEPVWSPDGSAIAFVNSANMAGGALRLISAETGAEIELPEPVAVTGTGQYAKLEFHPDGQRVLGVFRQAGRNHGLAWYNVKDGRVQSVAQLPSRSCYSLSTDGRWIAYTKSMDVAGQQGGNDGPQCEIWLVSAEGGEPRNIGRFPCRIHDLCWSHGFNRPESTQFTPNHALIVVSELGGVHYDLWKVPLVRHDAEEFTADVDSATKLTFGQADETRPSLSRDGRWLAYCDNRTGLTSVMVRYLERPSDSDQRVTVKEVDYGMPTGTVKISTRDKSSKQQVTARVSLQRERGKFHAHPQLLHRVLGDTAHFYCERFAALTVPAGKYHLRAWRGPEYRAASYDFEIKPNQDEQAAVDLERWHHAADDGWYSGENHIHANYGYGEWYNTPETMLRQCAGEDLNVCNFMVANSDTDGVFDREFFRGRLDPRSTDETLLYWNQEFRSTIWGHMTLVNLKQIVEPVFTGFKDTTNPWDIPTNSDVADRTHLQQGHVNYTHVAQNPDDPYVNPYTGKGIPVDVALGKIDTLDLNASYEGTVPLWYRLLNCGFHLPASAGTDVFLNRIRSRLPGGDRVYVHIDGGLSYERWIEDLQAGRSFVTNGPMLRLKVNGQPIGDTVDLPHAAEVHVEATALAQFPMDKVELVYNGEVVATGEFDDAKLSATIDTRIKTDRSGWLAVRASGPGHPDHPLGSQYAHTSPIYVQVGEQPAGAKGDALYFLKWIDRLELAVRVRDRIPGDAMRRHVQAQFDAAREVYAGIAERDE